MNNTSGHGTVPQVEGAPLPHVPLSDVRPGGASRRNKKKSRQISDSIPNHLQNIETNKTKLHVKFLEAVVEVLNDGSKIMNFEKPLGKKDVRFFKIALRCLNRRTQVGLTSDRERKLVGEILNGLSQRPGENIDFKFESENSVLVLSLLPKEDINKEKARSIIGRVQLNRPKSKSCNPKKLRRTVMKMGILAEVLVFMQGNLRQMVLHTVYGCEQELFKYMKCVCETLNSGEPFDRATTAEVEIVKEIAKHMNGKHLEVVLHIHIWVFTKIPAPGKEIPGGSETDATKRMQALECNKNESDKLLDAIKKIDVDEDLTDFSDMDDNEDCVLKNDETAQKQYESVQLKADTNNPESNVAEILQTNEGTNFNKSKETINDINDGKL